MKKIGTILIGASILNMVVANLAFAQSSTTSTKRTQAVKEVEKSPFSGSFTVGVGYDNNAMVSKAGGAGSDVAKGIAQGSFYMLSPSISYNEGVFNSTFGASVKDFSDQTLSNNAKETSANIGLGVSSKIFGDTQSNTNLNLDYSDARWPNFFADNNKDAFEGAGMPVRYTQVKLAQSLGWTIDRMNLTAGASFANRDYSSKYSDWAPAIFGPREFQNDQKILNANLRVGVKLSDNLEIGATPSVASKKYDERPARETDGSKAGLSGNAPMTEFITNELRADLRITTGVINITPYVLTGVQMDQATGGEDFTRTGGGLEVGLTIAESIGLKLSGSVDMVRNAYDNWTYSMKTGESKRQDDEVYSRVNLSVNLSKSVGLGVDYQNIKEESTFTDPDENYVQEIVTTNLSIRF